MTKAKKVFLLTLLSLLLCMPVIATQYTDVNVIVNDNVIVFPDQRPFIDSASSRTYVPLRFVSQELGAEVLWEQDTQTAVVKMNQDSIHIKIGSNTPTVNAKVINLDAPAMLINSRTMVPLRFIAEALQAEVNWDPTTSTVIITKQENAETSEKVEKKLNLDNSSVISPDFGNIAEISTKVTPFMGKKSFVDVMVNSTNIDGAVKYQTNKSKTIKNIGEMLRITADDGGTFTVTILDKNNSSLGTIELSVVNLVNHKYSM